MNTVVSVASLASAAAVSSPSIASNAEEAGNEMLYACIAHHRAARREFQALLNEKSKYDQRCFDRGEQPDDRYDDREAELGAAEHDAVWDLIASVPQSLGDLASMLAYLREAEVHQAFVGDDLDMLHCSIEVAICKFAGLPAPELAAVFQQTEKELALV